MNSTRKIALGYVGYGLASIDMTNIYDYAPNWFTATLFMGSTALVANGFFERWEKSEQDDR